MAHRGPDNAGVWQSADGTVALGSRRLAIIDLSPAAHQPMLDETGALVIVYNGEIYNYLELRTELERRGYGFRSHSDTEVLLAAYKEWGHSCLARLNGMFAFAIWDTKRQEMFAARDRFGEKPFYYCRPAQQEFLFASEIKALLASRVILPRPNLAAIYSYLAHRVLDVGEDTLFEGIRALPPAHALIFSRARDELRIWRYWDLDPEAEIHLPDDAAYAERFLELLTDAIRLRLRSDVPIGSSLSGGLDSSTIVCLIAKALKSNNKQKTFSARFHDPRYDEGRYIQKVIEWANVEGHMVYPDPARLPEEIRVVTWHQEQPFFSTSIYAQWNVMHLAKEQGVTVLLDGQGGDETLAGYHTYFGPYFRGLLVGLHWGTLIKDFYRYILEHGTRSLPVIFFNFLPEALRYPLRRRVRPLAISPKLARAWGNDEIEPPPCKFKDPLHEALYETLTRTSLPALLRYADRNSAAFSREIRLPFLDHRLVEFLFAIPADQKLRGVTTKFVMRNAIKGIVPEEIRLRKDKIGFAPPELAWMRGPLREWITNVFNSPQFRQRGWLEPKVVDRVWQGFLAGHDGWASLIWRWLSLEIWAQVFLDGNPSSSYEVRLQ